MSFLVLACDGVWDVCTDQDIVDIVVRMSRRENNNNPRRWARTIVRKALKRETEDNVSAVVISLSMQDPTHHQTSAKVRKKRMRNHSKATSKNEMIAWRHDTTL